MSELTPREYVLQTIASRLEDCERAQSFEERGEPYGNDGTTEDELPSADDVLCIDVEHIADVMLGVGGPTTYIRYAFDSDGGYKRAEWCTTDTPYGSSHGTESVSLSDDEATIFADVYACGLDSLAAIATGRES